MSYFDVSVMIACDKSSGASLAKVGRENFRV